MQPQEVFADVIITVFRYLVILNAVRGAISYATDYATHYAIAYETDYATDYIKCSL